MNKARIHNTTHRMARGFTLLEVLIAVLVLSIGLLGLAALQATGMKNNHSAHIQSQATILAYDILDRMRANRDAAQNNDYDLALNASAPSGSTIAETDLAQWRAQLAAYLPSGTGSVNVNGDMATVIVQWDDTRTEDGSATQQLQFQSEI
ncbi:TfP pilus assembly protein PilV [Thiohalobacter thiocyanaticus]|uniref:TfP pilus assembly protein PilV n=1 Tax=Thiohalobacter thiocyanaticus TaxID=585455 RepID=A0A1Z4VNX4_9GAMM|nr:type IV pilus modification protein PilV [Thiohalobacter thiocyanaticus]BAZ93317.1 TfP pilus assembly protein PilV [Thiohalobacter thiocyanaticus]